MIVVVKHGKLRSEHKNIYHDGEVYEPDHSLPAYLFIRAMFQINRHTGIDDFFFKGAYSQQITLISKPE